MRIRLTCVWNVGANYGWQSGDDVCEKIDDPGSWTFCSDDYPCPQGLGDCDSDSHCLGSLTCVDNVGANYGWASSVDVCE